MMGRIEKTVFISYRRTNLPWALAVYQDLTHKGYDVFFDYLSIPSGDFESIIIENIKARAHFVVILTPSALERCNEPGDWLRREIETAMEEKRNIVPLMLESFDFGSPSTASSLTGKLEKLKKYNGLRMHSEYFFEGMTRLREQYLNVALDAVIHPISESTKPITEEHQIAANEAETVRKEELTAQEWFERGYLSEDIEETIRCLTEAIRLDPELADAYTGRGLAYTVQDNLDQALLDFDTALSITKENPHTFIGRGNLRFESNDLDGAVLDFNEAIHIDPTLFHAYIQRGRALIQKGKLNSGIADITEAIRLKPNEAINYHFRAPAYEKKLDYSSAISDFQKYLELGGGAESGDQNEVEEKIKYLKSKLEKKKPTKKKKAK
jgi:tetratricopeptide (TPR) repeat protein